MVEPGWTPGVSECSVPSASEATSSSHQPPTKSLKALDAEEADGQPSSPRELSHSSGHADSVHLASPVPHAPELEEADDDGKHDGDDFVPNANRTSTLEPQGTDVHAKAEDVVVISDGPEFFDLTGDEAAKEDVKQQPKEEEREPARHGVNTSVGSSGFDGLFGSVIAAGGLDEVIRSSAPTETEGPQPTPPSELLKPAESSSKGSCVLPSFS